VLEANFIQTLRSHPPQRHSTGLFHDRIHRPLRRKRLTPPHWPPGNGNHAQPCGLECIGGYGTVCAEGVIDVGEEALKRLLTFRVQTV